MRNLQSIEEFESLKNTGKHIFLFSADWCPDCRVIEPFLPKLVESYQQYTFIYVDRDEFLDLCQQQDIFGIPSFIAFENGVELGRFVSKDRKTEAEIKHFIEGLD